MKRVIIAIFTLAILGFAPAVRAQDFNFERAYQDYLYSRGVYDQTYTDYTKARDFYLANQTLTLKEEARKKTLTMLRERDQLFAVYLTAIRIKILEIAGLTGDEKNSIFGKIDSEVAWYKGHKDNYKEGDVLEDLFNKSDEAKSRYTTNTLPLLYESLFTVSFGEGKTIRQEQETVYASLRTIIDEDVKAGKLDINPFNRWFSDIDLVIKNLVQNDELAKTQIQKVYGRNISTASSYNASLNILSTSLGLLGQLNQFLTEIVASIRNQI